MRSRVPAAVALSVTMLAGSALLLAGADPAGAAGSHPSVAARSAAPDPAVPSHPLTVELPGLATVSVDVPDIPALLGAGRHSSGSTAPVQPQQSQQTAKPGHPAAPQPKPTDRALVPTTSRTVAPATSRPRQSGAPATVRSDARKHRPATNGPARTIRHDATTPGKRIAKPAAARKAAPTRARPLAEVFQGMLHPGLPVWLLAGIVVACGLGTVVVVRSAGRKSLT